jgi:hypothetical protein
MLTTATILDQKSTLTYSQQAHVFSLLMAGFSPSKLKNDAKKMRRLNKKGTNWFLAFFRQLPDSRNPWGKLQQCRKRKDSLKRIRIELDERLTRSFKIDLPNETVDFGFSLIRIKRGRSSAN